MPVYRVNISDYIAAYRYSDFAVEAANPDEARERAEAFIESDTFDLNYDPSRFQLRDAGGWSINSIIEVHETPVFQSPDPAPAEDRKLVLYTDADWAKLQAEAEPE